ncbi:MAG: FAD-binding protein, partial [Acidobacteriota bacterium]|nr:FAD-binding protein [Acidobacteriota bacterium]
RVEIVMKRVANSAIDVETIRYGGLDEFFALSEESVARHEYAVAWVDTMAGGEPGRGLFIRGNHNGDAARTVRSAPRGPYVTFPPGVPFRVLNGATLKAFNTGYYWARRARNRMTVEAGPFFYPLDAIGEYHRMYGPGGMLQWQGLIPSREAVREVLAFSRKLGGSFLTVMKVMGEFPGSGMLSFSGAGTTVALDFPYSERLLRLLPRLDEIVAEAGGRLYPAKDARMSGRHFRQFYPQWREMDRFIDPRFSSSFWRRVMAGAQGARSAASSSGAS